MVSETLLRRRDVEQIVGLSRSTIYLKMSRGEFPRPVSVGSGSVRWLASDVDRWVKSLPPPDAN